MKIPNYLRSKCPVLLVAGLGGLLIVVNFASAAVRYVDVNSPSPTPPYTNWPTAAHVIQQAVDAAAAGDEIVVTNGIYATGGRAVYGTMTNRVAVYKPLTLRSVNGQQFTIIDGANSIRCMYLTNGASLSGFTVTNGMADSGGGLFCESATVVVSNCVVVGNSASYDGGGAIGGTLVNCTLSGNSANYAGGGAYGGTLNNCRLACNWSVSGGGAEQSAVNNCTLTGNSALDGGGAQSSTLNNCILTGNSAEIGGGGAENSTLNNCSIIGNSAVSAYVGQGGGALGGTLNNCTLAGNLAGDGGGAEDSTLNNCIVYFNSAVQDANYDSSCTLNYCCTTPLPPGNGNISADPQLTDSVHLGAESSCVAAGSAAYTSGVDIDGQPWANPPSIGCDEFHPGAAFGPLKLNVSASFTNVLAGGSLGLTALIKGNAAASIWDWGDGSFATNEPFADHSWSTPGDYAVVLRAFNDSQPTGVSATQLIHVIGSIRLLVPSGGNVASSADGSKLVTATGLYTSTNSGATWILTAAPPGGNGLASSAEGFKLATISYNGRIFGSTNSGATWASIGAANWNSNYAPDLRGITCSADGNKLVAVSCGTTSNGVYLFNKQPIYRSTNFGASWTITSAPNEGWLAVASSADGVNLVAVAGVNSVSIGGTDGGPIYTSTNSGVTWQAANVPIARWFCVASSADGKKLVAGAFGDAPNGGIYTSTNGGKDWALTSAPAVEGWISVASSANGEKLVAISEGLAVYEGADHLGSPIYFSADSGGTWIQCAPARQWGSVACSADGAKIIAQGSGTYAVEFPSVSSSIPLPPRLSIRPSAASLGISWLVPSTSFVLQQNSDMTTTNWTEVSTTPSLNFTNLHYEVTASPTNGQGFYRLRQQ